MTPSVLMVIAQFPPSFVGGAEKMAETFAGEFRERGMLYRIVTRCFAANKRPVRDDLPVDVLSIPETPVLGSFLYLLKLSLYLIRHRHHYDVIYLGMPKYNAIVCSVFAALLGKKLVVKFESPTWERQGDKVHRIRFFGLFLFALRRADAVVVLNTQMFADLLGLGVAPNKVLIIPNAVDTLRFAPVVDKEAYKHLFNITEKKVIIFLGRLLRAKGVFVLLRSFAAIASDHPSVRLMFIGDGEEREALNREALALGIGNRVTIRSTDNPAPMLACGDLYVLPSESEGVSCAMLEAMATGLCAIATPVGGNREVLTENKTGVFVPVGDVDRLGEILKTLLIHDNERRRLATAGREHVRSAYSLDKLTCRYADLFSSLLTNDAGAESTGEAF